MYDIYPNRDALTALKDQLHEAWPPSHRDGHPCVPEIHKEAITDFLSNVIAELIESYLDAGSERDAIAQGIHDAMFTELGGWTEVE